MMSCQLCDVSYSFSSALFRKIAQALPKPSDVDPDAAASSEMVPVVLEPVAPAASAAGGLCTSC